MGCSSLIRKIFVAIGFGLLLAPLFKPASVAYVFPPWVADAYAVGLVVSGAVSLILYVALVRIEASSCLVLALGLSLLASTLANGDSFESWYGTRWPAYCVAALLAAVGFRKAKSEFLAALFALTMFLSVANAISMVLYPAGVYVPNQYTPRSDCFFWGNRNTVYQLVLVSTGAGFLLGELYGRRFAILGIASLVIGAWQICMNFSATSCVALAVVAVCLAAVSFKKLRPFLSLPTFLGVYAAFFIGIVIARMQNYFAFFIEGVLHKDLTFTKRTGIWDRVFSVMDSGHWLQGYGVRSYRQLDFGDFRAAHAHNELLNIWLMGGAVSIAFYAALIILATVRMVGKMSEYATAVIAVTLGGFLVVGLTESVSCTGLFIFLVAACCWGQESSEDAPVTHRLERGKAITVS